MVSLFTLPGSRKQVHYTSLPPLEPTRCQFLGNRKSDGARFYLIDPKWRGDLDYPRWEFDLVGRFDEACFPLSNHTKSRKELEAYLSSNFDLNPKVATKIEVFADLIATAYTLREAARVFELGNSGIVMNPCRELLRDPALLERIEAVLLPAIFDRVKEIFGTVSHSYEEAP